MSAIIIITICLLLLFAYFFDITSAKTKIPSVILLLLLGWGVKHVVFIFKINIPDLSPILPALGTIGLILIVLEGSLELELNSTKISIISKSSLMAFLPMIILSFSMAYVLSHFETSTYKNALGNAIPLTIISSAIAIPSARNLISHNKEFVTYESSISDILGVIFFNFIILNETISSRIFGVFLIQLFVLIIISFISTAALAFILSKIKHHVKFVPIILLVILIYSISKIYHLPSLLFILLFGLFIGNFDEIKRFKFIEKLQPEILNKEVQKFREITGEITFLIRSLFFLLFGYLIEASELFNPGTIIWAISITGGIFIIRGSFLKLLKLPLQPLLFVAPRGLITILLFLSIPLHQALDIVNRSLIIQVIILTSLVMMFGLLPKKETNN